MGMRFDGKWDDIADLTMISGVYRRQPSTLPTLPNNALVHELQLEPQRFVLIASASCPQSHAAMIATVLGNHSDSLTVQWAGGPHAQGYGLFPGGPIIRFAGFKFVHQPYTITDPVHADRATCALVKTWFGR